MAGSLSVRLVHCSAVTVCRNAPLGILPGVRSHSLTYLTQCRMCSSASQKAARQAVDDLVDRKFNKNIIPPETMEHFRELPTEIAYEKLPKNSAEKLPMIGVNAMPHPIWSNDEVHDVEETHHKPKGFVDRLAYTTVQSMRIGLDILSGFNRKPRNEAVWLNRIAFLETLAGVPGMVAAMVRHLHSLRMLRRDHGWIHTLLEEAENERMHLMTALQLKQPSWAFRTAVVGAQGFFVTTFSVWYLISPRFCHRFVGYLEEEAVVTYTKVLEDIDRPNGTMQHWRTQPAPEHAIHYWKLEESATMRDVILAIRADEAHHRVVNHTLGSLKADDYNPYRPGK